MKYLVTNIYRYTSTVEVEAECRVEALAKALNMADERKDDDFLYDQRVEELE